MCKHFVAGLKSTLPVMSSTAPSSTSSSPLQGDEDDDRVDGQMFEEPQSMLVLEAAAGAGVLINPLRVASGSNLPSRMLARTSSKDLRGAAIASRLYDSMDFSSILT